MTGKQHYLDAHIAYRRACLNAIEYLKKFGYTGEQAYVIIGTAPCEGRISGIVDIPNACCTLAIPTENSNSTSSQAPQGQRNMSQEESTLRRRSKAMALRRSPRNRESIDTILQT